LHITGQRGAEKWFYTEWLSRRRATRQLLETRARTLSQSSGEHYESVLARLQEEEVAKNIERSKVMPAFFSLDNPILIAGIVTAVGVAIASSTGR
jgi:hypothetical protein